MGPSPLPSPPDPHITSHPSARASRPQGCEAMDAAFSGLSSASFAAEHGCFYRLGSLPGVRRPLVGGWRQLIEGLDFSWKESARAVMEAYTARTNGAQTHVKVRASTCVDGKQL
eukprot:scaffold25176_cov73-Isochrysis_galbana.AAC.1